MHADAPEGKTFVIHKAEEGANLERILDLSDKLKNTRAVKKAKEEGSMEGLKLDSSVNIRPTVSSKQGI